MNISFKEECGLMPNIQAEMSVVGCIIAKPEILPEVVFMLSDSDFLVGEIRSIYMACKCLFKDNIPIDGVSITQIVSEPLYRGIIANCVETVPIVSNWKVYAEIIRETAIKNRVFDWCEAMLKGVVSDTTSDIQAKITNLAGSINTQREKDIFSAYDGFYDYFVSLQHDPKYLQTGFSSLDNFLNVEDGDYIIIGARPSVGKTAFALQTMLNMCKWHRVLFFSLETKKQKIFGRLISNFAETGLDNLKKRKNIDFVKLARKSNEFSNLNFSVVEAAGYTVPEIESISVQQGAQVVFVDYLGLIRAQGSSRYEKVTNISMELANMARKRKITVIALCQLNREGKGEPGLEHLRESGQIEQDADAILLLHANNGNNSKERDVIVAKNKEGQTGKIPYVFYGNAQKFYEVSKYVSNA